MKIPLYLKCSIKFGDPKLFRTTKFLVNKRKSERVMDVL